MRLSTKGRYATRLLLAMSRNTDGRPVRKQSLAEAELISVDYVAQILVLLKRAGLVDSVRGKYGGFRLARPPEKISVWEILVAADEALKLAPCLGHPSHCKRECDCVCRNLWQGALGALEAYFSDVSLAELRRRELSIEELADGQTEGAGQ